MNIQRNCGYTNDYVVHQMVLNISGGQIYIDASDVVCCYLCEIQIPVRVLRTRNESIISDRWHEDIPERMDKLDIGDE